MADPSDDIDDVDTGDIDASSMPTAQYPVVNPLAYGQRWTRDPTMMRGALDLMQRSYRTSADAIREAKQALLAKRTGNGEAWLAFGAGLLKPTRTGSFGESLGQAGEAMLGPLQRSRAEEMQRRNMITGYDLKSASLDRDMARTMMQAAKVPAGQTGPAFLPIAGGDSGPGATGTTPASAPGSPWEIPPEYEGDVLEASKRTGVPPQAIAGLIYNESRWNPNAVATGDQPDINPKTGKRYDSVGLGQWGEQYAKQRGFNPRDPKATINATADRLKELAGSYGGNYAMARLAYGWGEGNVKNWLDKGANPNAINNDMKMWLARSITGANTWDQASKDWPRIAKMLRPGPVDVQYPEYTARGASPSPGDVGALPGEPKGSEPRLQAGKPPPEGATTADAGTIMPGLKVPEGTRSIVVNPKTMLPYTDKNGNIATVNRNGGITYVQAPKKGTGSDRIKRFNPDTGNMEWYRQSTGQPMLDADGKPMLAGPAPADPGTPGGTIQAMMPDGNVGIWVPRANGGKGDWQRDAQGTPLKAPRLDPQQSADDRRDLAEQRMAHATTVAKITAELRNNTLQPGEAEARYNELFQQELQTVRSRRSVRDTTGQDRPPVPPTSGGVGPGGLPAPATPPEPGPGGLPGQPSAPAPMPTVPPGSITTPPGTVPPPTGGAIPRAPVAPQVPTTPGTVPPPVTPYTRKPSIDEQAEARANAPINAKYIDDARRAADSAGVELAQINTVRSLNEKDITGAMAPMKEFMGRWAEALGLESIGGKKVRDFISAASDRKSFDSMTNAFLLAVQEAQKGVATEGDAKRISMSWAALGNTKETNKFLLDYYENMAWWKKSRAAYLNNAVSRPGGTNKAAIREWEDFKRKTPLTAMVGPDNKQLMFLPQFIKQAQAARPNDDPREVEAAAIAKWQERFGGK